MWGKKKKKDPEKAAVVQRTSLCGACNAIVFPGLAHSCFDPPTRNCPFPGCEETHLRCREHLRAGTGGEKGRWH
jgi:hypothetical protein